MKRFENKLLLLTLRTIYPVFHLTHVMFGVSVTPDAVCFASDTKSSSP